MAKFSEKSMINEALGNTNMLSVSEHSETDNETKKDVCEHLDLDNEPKTDIGDHSDIDDETKKDVGEHSALDNELKEEAGEPKTGAREQSNTDIETKKDAGEHFNEGNLDNEPKTDVSQHSDIDNEPKTNAGEQSITDIETKTFGRNAVIQGLTFRSIKRFLLSVFVLLLLLTMFLNICIVARSGIPKDPESLVRSAPVQSEPPNLSGSYQWYEKLANHNLVSRDDDRRLPKIKREGEDYQS